jgi:hypothetical protein
MTVEHELPYLASTSHTSSAAPVRLGRGMEESESETISLLSAPSACLSSAAARNYELCDWRKHRALSTNHSHSEMSSLIDGLSIGPCVRREQIALFFEGAGGSPRAFRLVERLQR